MKKKRSDAGARDAALLAGEKSYFTGKPCLRGHVARRLVSNWTCFGCLYEKTKTRITENPSYRRRINDRVRRARLADIERDAARHSKWKRDNPDKVTQYTHKRRAIKLAAAGEYTAQEVQDLLVDQNYTCANHHCAVDLRSTKRHLDHKTPLSRGGSNGIENLQWLCQSCNCRKWTYTQDEWLGIVAARNSAIMETA